MSAIFMLFFLVMPVYLLAPANNPLTEPSRRVSAKFCAATLILALANPPRPWQPPLLDPHRFIPTP